MRKNKRMIPEEFASFEEAQEFWDTHSAADYWDEMHDVDLQLSPSLQAKLEAKKLYRLLGLSSQQIRKIEQEATREQTNTRQLIAHWVLEHVESVHYSSY